MTRSILAACMALLISVGIHAQDDPLTKWGAQNYVHIKIPSNLEVTITFYINTKYNLRAKAPSPDFAEYLKGPFTTGLDGTISLALPPGYYHYLATSPGKKSQNGSFFIHSRKANMDTNFEVRLITPDPGCSCNAYDSEKLVYKGYDLLYEKEKKKARKVFYVAAMEGNATAMWKYAQMCEEGIGGKKNKNHATYWYRQAASHGESYSEAKVGRTVYQKTDASDEGSARGSIKFNKSDDEFFEDMFHFMGL